MANAVRRGDNGFSARPLVELPLTPFLNRAARAAREAHARSRPRPIRAYPATSQMQYTEYETEFLMAIDAYKREHHKPFLTNTEMYAILTVKLSYGKIREEE